MKLDLFNLRQTFDVRQLKKSLWDHINPRITAASNAENQEEIKQDITEEVENQ